MRHEILPHFCEEGKKLLLVCRGIHAIYDSFNHVRVCFQKRLTKLFIEVTQSILAEPTNNLLFVKLKVIVEVRQVI